MTSIIDIRDGTRVLITIDLIFSVMAPTFENETEHRGA